ncbi:large conductance mechanosensitive channel protein MscL [Lentibacillus sp. CBA3610]|uniref:large conductance mechanosensitive channel protein MscL n=1 Tax=Lentibacillus sp. CBA3610 TaxID=2518176 RepID=UPI0015953E15|nr:large conductance mechanosensitive channel protein MscL [Lentibacillus sp. CBA3610]QKY68344.1 large conductance mechanosensitive channel protein MscL [Lentibacillus sp. CBA3610]
MWADFKAFALKGNVLDLAVAVVVGSAFGKIVTSLVENIITPLASVLGSGVDFTNLTYTVRNVDVLYGEFLQSVFDFAVISVSIFIFIRLVGKVRREEDSKKTPKPDEKEKLLSEIHDLLKNGNQQKAKKKMVVNVGTRKDREE